MSQGREVNTQQDIEEHAKATAKAKEENRKDIAVAMEASRRGGIRQNNLIEENAGVRIRAHRRWAIGLQAAKRWRGQSYGM